MRFRVEVVRIDFRRLNGRRRVAIPDSFFFFFIGHLKRTFLDAAADPKAFEKGIRPIKPSGKSINSRFLDRSQTMAINRAEIFDRIEFIRTITPSFWNVSPSFPNLDILNEYQRRRISQKSGKN